MSDPSAVSNATRYPHDAVTIRRVANGVVIYPELGPQNQGLLIGPDEQFAFNQPEDLYDWLTQRFWPQEEV